MQTIRQQFPKIRTCLLRRKRRYEVDARRKGGGRRFYFTDRPSAVRKAQELAALAEVQPLTPLPVEMQRPDLLQRLLSLLDSQPAPTAPATGRSFPELLDEWVEARRDDKFKPLRPPR